MLTRQHLCRSWCVLPQPCPHLRTAHAGDACLTSTRTHPHPQTAAMGKRGNNSGGAASAAFWERKRANFQPSGISMSGGGTGVYVPPTKRGAGSSMSDRDNSNTLRVTNLSPETKDMDVRELFSRFGHVTRVYLVRSLACLPCEPAVV